MTELSERLNRPLSTATLERRWTALRDAMEERGIDVLVAQGTNDFHGGYVRYLLDVPAVAGVPVTVVFPRSDDMTVVMHGAMDGQRHLPPEGDGVFRGVGRILTTSSFTPVHYTHYYDAARVVEALAPYRSGSIGLVGPGQFTHATVEHVTRELDRSERVDATDLVDRLKAIKSEEEQELIRETAALQDAAMAAAFAAVEPGVKESDVAAAAQHVAQGLGAEQCLS